MTLEIFWNNFSGAAMEYWAEEWNCGSFLSSDWTRRLWR